MVEYDRSAVHKVDQQLMSMERTAYRFQEMADLGFQRILDKSYILSLGIWNESTISFLSIQIKYLIFNNSFLEGWKQK